MILYITILLLVYSYTHFLNTTMDIHVPSWEPLKNWHVFFSASPEGELHAHLDLYHLWARGTNDTHSALGAELSHPGDGRWTWWYKYIQYIYTLGAGGSPKVLWVGFCEWLKIVISLWRNVSFWRSHSLHRIVFCADEIFLIRVLIDQKSIIHTFIFVRNVWFVW